VSIGSQKNHDSRFNLKFPVSENDWLLRTAPQMYILVHAERKRKKQSFAASGNFKVK
jgi:hypothetical protein